ncbi:Transmembrane protein 65 [Perkinsus olseni]|uniref:Transmembrane protein 65 n=1 Tax=Perkinsus olseni TaxID=32597 RepID=A0A7J6RMG2_PEROL|nr:Transmembrane protein 65 [Perkinsus olseni]
MAGRGSSLTIDQDDLTRRIKQAVSMGYGIRRLQEVLQDSTVNSSTNAKMERGWRKLRESDSKLLKWFDARARGCHHLRCALLIVVKSRLTAAMTRLQLLMEHTPTQDSYHHVQQIPKLHHLFSAMYEAEVAVGVARLHALVEKALHRHLRAAITVLSSWHGFEGGENNNNNPRPSVAASVVTGSTSHVVDGRSGPARADASSERLTVVPEREAVGDAERAGERAEASDRKGDSCNRNMRVLIGSLEIRVLEFTPLGAAHESYECPISRTACLDNCTAAKARHFCGTTLGANSQPPPSPQSTPHGLENPAKVDDITEFLALARDDLNMVAKDLADSNTIDNNALQWMRNYRVTSLSDTPEKANYILKWTFICSAIPFIGFGFLDNALMLIFGEQIDNSLCVVMGFSTLAAAALGNAFSDLAGVFAGSHIEHQAELRGVKVPQVSLKTQSTPRFKMAKSFGQAAGLFFGCLLGMAPLLWLDPLKAARTRLQNKRREIFDETIGELCKILGAKSGVLMLVDKDKNELFSETGGSKGVFRSPIDEDNAGIMGYVAATGQMVNIEDVSKTDFYDKTRHDDYHGHGFEAGSIICMPIFDSLGNILGVVELAKSRHSGRTFSEKDEDLLAAMSSHIATYLHGADAPQTFRAVLNACSSNMLVKSSRVLLSQQQREERLFADVMHEVKRVMKAEAAMLMLMDDSTSDQTPVLYTKYCEGIDISETTPVGVGIMGHVAQTGKPFIADDVREAGELYDPERHENYKGTGRPVRSVMCVPIFDTRRRVIGVIEVINKKSQRGELDFFTERDRDILGNIANHVALNVEGTGSSLRKVLRMVREQSNTTAQIVRSPSSLKPIQLASDSQDSKSSTPLLTNLPHPMHPSPLPEESPLVTPELYKGYEATSPIAPLVDIGSAPSSPRKEYTKVLISRIRQSSIYIAYCILCMLLSLITMAFLTRLDSPFVRESKTEKIGLGFIEVLLTSAIASECALDMWAQGVRAYFISLWHIFDFALALTSIACLAAEAVAVRSLPERPAAMLIMLRYGMMVARIVKFAHDACSAQIRVRVVREAAVDFSKLPSDDDNDSICAGSDACSRGHWSEFLKAVEAECLSEPGQWLTGTLLAAEPLLRRLLDEVYLNNKPDNGTLMIEECPRGFGKLFLIQNTAEQLTSPDTVQHARGMEILSGELREAFGFSAEFAKAHLSETLLRQAWNLRREAFRELIDIHVWDEVSLVVEPDIIERICPVFVAGSPSATLMASFDPLGLSVGDSWRCEFILGPLDNWRLLPGDPSLMRARLAEAAYLLQARPDIGGVSMRSKLLDEYTNSEYLAALLDPGGMTEDASHEYLLLQLGMALRGIPEILAGIRGGLVEIPGLNHNVRPTPCGFDLACSQLSFWNYTGYAHMDVWLRRLDQPREGSPLMAISRGIFRHTHLESVDTVPPYEFDIPAPGRLQIFIAPVDVVVPCREMFGWLLVDAIQELSLALASFRRSNLHLVLPELIHVHQDSRWTTEEPLDEWPLEDAVQQACRLTNTEERIAFSGIFDHTYFTETTGVQVIDWGAWKIKSLDWLVMLRELPLPGGYTEGVFQATGPHIPCLNATDVNRVAILFGRPVLVKNTLCVASTTNASWDPQAYRAGLEAILSDHTGATINIGFYFYYWLGGERSRMTMSSARVTTSMVMPSLWRSIRFSPAVQQVADTMFPDEEYIAVHWRWRATGKILKWPKTAGRLIPTWVSTDKRRQFHFAQPQSFARLVFNALPSTVRCYNKFFLMTNLRQNSSQLVQFEDELIAMRREQCLPSSGALNITVGSSPPKETLSNIGRAKSLVLEMAVAAKARHFVGFADGWIAGTASVLTLIVTQMRVHQYHRGFDSTTFAFDGGNEYLP